MEEYFGIVAEKVGNTYKTPESGHIKRATLVKVDYNGNIIGEKSVGKLWPGLGLTVKAIFDPYMRSLATPFKLKAAKFLGIEKNIGVGSGKDLSTIVRDLQSKYHQQEKLAPAYALR